MEDSPVKLVTTTYLSRRFKVSLRCAERWFSQHGLRDWLKRGRALRMDDLSILASWLRHNNWLLTMRSLTQATRDELFLASGLPGSPPQLAFPKREKKKNQKPKRKSKSTAKSQSPSPDGRDSPIPIRAGMRHWTLTDVEAAVLHRLIDRMDDLVPETNEEWGQAIFASDGIKVPGNVIGMLIHAGYIELDLAPIPIERRYIPTDHACNRFLSLMESEAA